MGSTPPPIYIVFTWTGKDRVSLTLLNMQAYLTFARGLMPLTLSLLMGLSSPIVYKYNYNEVAVHSNDSIAWRTCCLASNGNYVLWNPSIWVLRNIVKIAWKAHQRANLIHRCFTSKNSDLLLRSYITYVRPMLEYNSPLWSPSLKKDIILLESVQRRFITKRFLDWPPWHIILGESLELRRLRADLTLVYKILFGVRLFILSDKLFSLTNEPQLRVHNYTLNKPRCCSHTRKVFSTYEKYQFME